MHGEMQREFQRGADALRAEMPGDTQRRFTNFGKLQRRKMMPIAFQGKIQINDKCKKFVITS